MADWSSAQYLKFADERTRPAADLLARVGADKPDKVVDIGCGPGNSTALLAQRWPDAELVGFDSSPDMIAAARERLPDVHFAGQAVEGWTPEANTDVLFANASLQWTADPVATIHRLHEAQSAGGWTAVQVPDTVNERTHRLMEQTAAAMPFAEKVVGRARKPLPAAEIFHDALADIATTVDIWRTTYFHRMPDIDAIVEWVRSTALKPYLDLLSEGERAAFLADYRGRLEQAYPPMANGGLLLHYPRLFIVSQRR